MESFLHDLESEGARQSEGSFTVSVRQAQMKLAEYQLSSFEMFGNFLVEAAHAAGARALDLVVTDNRRAKSGRLTTVYFRGWSLSLRDIEALDPQKAETLSKRSLKHLGVVLSALSARHVLTLRSRAQDHLTLTVRVQHGLMNTSVEKESGHPLNTTTLRVAYDLTPEIMRAFQSRAVWSQVLLSHNKALLPSGPQTVLTPQHVEGRLVGEDCPESFLAPEVEQSRSFQQEGPSGFPGSHLLFLTDPKEAQELGLSLRYDGTTYPVLSDLCKYGICGYVSADDLRRDISFTGLLRNSNYSQRLQQVRELIAELLKGILSSEHTISQDTYLNVQVLLRKLSRHLGLSEHQNLLDKATAQMKPTLQGSGFELQQGWFPRASQAERQRLLLDYQELIEKLRGEGLPDEAASYLENKATLQRGAGEPQEFNRIQEFLYLMMQGEKAPKQRFECPILNEYLNALQIWRDGLSPDFSPSFHNEAHASWLLPFEIHLGLRKGEWNSRLSEEQTPPWVKLLRLSSEGRGLEALHILRSTPSLGFEERPLHWYRFLWFNLRGKVPFSTAVSFRAKLSLAQARSYGSGLLSWSKEDYGRLWNPDNPYHTGHFAELRRECVEEAYFGKEFWPQLCALLESSLELPEWQSVKIWSMVCAQSLLGNLYRTGPKGNPLARPFLECPELL